ncbi:uncharacterized protein IUM83_06647 [Phytophthora cinnamomi]|uniref:uncharacterized protein n=1 Tax=Phytophthora cinnamomi TaxID=4785 RepID=UPI0035599E27|nr:hypothetical protein IUM83_06647 [Phytophthora cinnamomi]
MVIHKSPFHTQSSVSETFTHIVLDLSHPNAFLPLFQKPLDSSFARLGRVAANPALKFPGESVWKLPLAETAFGFSFVLLVTDTFTNLLYICSILLTFPA